MWSLHNIPGWLEHTPANVDGMGLADVVFPAFLFIVGLSIPFAAKARQKKGDSKLQMLWHIVQRTFALIVMGIFMVNRESINNDLLPFSKYIWQILMALAFFLIWNNYQQKKVFGKIPDWVMQLAGVLILIFLAYVYQGGATENPVWMKTHWWGILGLIGWSYLLCALVYLFIGDNLLIITIVWLVLHFLNVQEFLSLPEGVPHIKFVISASNHASVMSGVLATVFYIKLRNKVQPRFFVVVLLVLAFISLVYGFALRPVWGISKIHATPSWTAICAGISFAVYALLYIIADVFILTRWAQIIAPAGRSTLTCYIVPYYVYAIMALTGFSLPLILTGGFIGILKSLIFSLLIIFITRGHEMLKIRLKI